MKNCPNCKSEVPNEFDICWKCNYDFINESVTESEINEAIEIHDTKNLNCLRCETKMEFYRKQTLYKYREPTIFAGVFGNTTVMDMYVCPSCQKMEFFYVER